MMTSGTHGYCYFRQYLVLSDLSLHRAARVLLFGYNRYRIRSLGISLSDIVVGLMILMRQKLRAASRPVVELPVSGDLAMRVHRGHKVFDLEAATVTKVFAPDVTREEAAAQVNASRLASTVAAAPRFVGADKEFRWYSEEYIRGRHGTDAAAAREGQFMNFYSDVESCLLDLIRNSSNRKVDLVKYLDDLTDPTLLHSWNVRGESQDAAHEISNYQAELKRWLSNNLPSPELELVLTHGDFSLVNVIVDGGFRVIDWEGIRYGSLFGDAVNFVFVEKYYGRARSDITAEIDFLLQHFAETVVQQVPRLASAATVPKIFALRLYYLERLKLMLERDLTANLISVVRKSVQMFREFDTAAGFPNLEEC